ncbi:MAG TPA: sigma-70 family RNA polymerase sigma factor, partial [Syntrophorhabdaceae bacterium]|nr:sigma-70 family RNA polymerase sigma factor [Syntrophorhabdaceae bacterium]
NPDYHFSTWITKITVNICLDRIRKKSQEQGAAEDIEEIADERMNPEERCIMEEQRRRIRKAVAALPEQYRVPLVLFHQEGFSYEAMVDIIGEPLSIIKNRLYRARLMLRSALKPEKETIP